MTHFLCKLQKITITFSISSVDIIRIWLKLSKIWLTIWLILPENLTKIWPKSYRFWQKSDQNKLWYSMTSMSSLSRRISSICFKNVSILKGVDLYDHTKVRQRNTLVWSYKSTPFSMKLSNPFMVSARDICNMAKMS